MIPDFEFHNPLRRPPDQPRRRTSRRNRRNGAVDMRHLDSVLQDLGFAPKPHPTIFTENEPDALFDGLEKFQKANGLTVDGAVKNKDSETGIALNKAMAENYVPSQPKQAGLAAGNNGPEEAKLPKPDVIPTSGKPDWQEPNE